MAAELAERQHRQAARLGIRGALGDRLGKRRVEREVGEIGQRAGHPFEIALARQVAEGHRQCQRAAALAQERAGRPSPDRHRGRDRGLAAFLDEDRNDRRDGLDRRAQEGRELARARYRRGAPVSADRVYHATISNLSMTERIHRRALAVVTLMTMPPRLSREPEFDRMDRRLIKIEYPPAQAGIAAALRRAFEAGSSTAACDQDFQHLLSKIR